MEYKADEIPPLTIFLSKEQSDVRQILSKDNLGDLSIDSTGTLDMHGLSLSENVVLIFSGKYYRYDGRVDEHRFMIKPKYVSLAEGACSSAGFLNIDFKDKSLIRNLNPNAEDYPRFGSIAGTFRGEIIATEETSLSSEVSSSLSDYYIKPKNFFQRPPNRIRKATFSFRPNVAISLLIPSDKLEHDLPCLGDSVIDMTIARTELAIDVEIDGFPAERPVVVEVTYIVPRDASASDIAHLWDFATGWLAKDVTTDTIEVLIENPDQNPVFQLPFYTTLESAWGSKIFAMDIEVRAYIEDDDSLFSAIYTHQLTVADEGARVIADFLELCPLGDEACHQARDADVADNVVARRNVIECEARTDGLYKTITRSMGRCSGGDSVSNPYSKDCVVYRESTDTELSFNVEAELNFELNVNGEAQGQKSWGGTIEGLGSADIEAAFQGTFALNADLDASFETSRTWENHHSLDVIYNPQNTQIQWWRVVTPRLRYLEIAEYNSCGTRSYTAEIFLSDLRDSRLVLACESVPSYDSVCHAVEPTEESVASCESLLIDPDSQVGQACMTADDGQ
jgi:hypothetical protein